MKSFCRNEDEESGFPSSSSVRSTYVEGNAKFLIQMERRRFLVDVVTPGRKHPFDPQGSLSEVSEMMIVNARLTRPPRLPSIDNSVIFALFHQNVVDTQGVLIGTTNETSPFASIVSSYLRWNVQHETIFTRVGQSHRVDMTDETNIDFLVEQIAECFSDLALEVVSLDKSFERNR